MLSSAALGAVDDLDNAASERTPLIRSPTNSSTEACRPGSATSAGSWSSSPSGASVPASVKRRTIWLIYAIAFLAMFGENMQPAARVQVYEDVVCDNYYAVHPPPGDASGRDAMCKIKAVQDEVALLKGFEYFLQVLPTLLCTVPLCMLADRVGRRWIMAANLFGIMVSECWGLAVCHWSRVLPVRLVWLTGIVQFIGGGPALTSALIHIMVVDVATEDERTRVFVFIHAATVVSGFLAPMATGALMANGHVWAALLTAEGLLAVACFVLIPALPETVHLRSATSSKASSITGPIADGDDSGAASRGNVDDDEPDGPVKPASNTLARGLKEAFSSFAVLADTLVARPQAALLVAVYTPCLFSREAFSMIGLLYVGKKFGVPYARSNALLSLSALTQAALTLAILPAASWLLSSERAGPAWTPWRRDRAVSVASLAVAVLGHAVLGLAPTLVLAVAGLVLVALSVGASSTLLALLASAVPPGRVSAVYSAAIMLAVAVTNALAPVSSVLFSVGMRLGWSWTGMPFLGLAGIMLAALGGSLFIRRPG